MAGTSPAMTKERFYALIIRIVSASPPYAIFRFACRIMSTKRVNR
jgi:hypothetical protein